MQTRTVHLLYLNILLLAGTVTVVAGVMEFGFRLIAPQIPIRHPLMYAPHEALRYVPNPGTSWQYRTSEFDTQVAFNSHGFRGADRPLEKPSNTFRILCLGDSFTLGAEVQQTQSYPHVLEQRLNAWAAERGDSLRYEVLNGGVGGYGTFQELMFLKEFGLSHQPDLVLVQFYANDVRDNMAFQKFWNKIYPDSVITVSQSSILPRSFMMPSLQYASMWGEVPLWASAVKSFLEDHSHLYHFIRARTNILISVLGLRQLTAFDDLMIMMPEYSSEIEEGWNLTRSLYLKMQNLVHQQNAGFALLLVPNKAQVVQNWRYDAWLKEQQLDLGKPVKILEAFGKEHEVPVFDFLPDLKKASTDQALYFNWDGHWNAAGCRVAGESLAHFLLEKQLIPLSQRSL